MSLQNLDKWSLEQRQAILTRDMNVLVSAGAGSGKTTVLVERVASIVCSDDGVDLDTLLIVTFTEAAASEMRERIAKRLTALGQEARDSGDNTLARRISQQLGLLEQSQISTLHSFCLDIVRRNFFSLGLEPTFALLSEEDGVLQKSQVLQELLEKHLAQDNSGGFSRMLKRFRATNPEQLQRLVLRVDGFARSQHNPKEWLQTVAAQFHEQNRMSLSKTGFFAPFRAWVERKTENAVVTCRRALELAEPVNELQKYTDNLAQLQNQLGILLQRIREDFEIHDVLPELDVLDALLNVKGLRAKAHPLKDVVRELRAEVKQELEDVVAVLRRGESGLLQDMEELEPDVLCFLEFVEDFQRAAWEKKQTTSRLDFNDLEHLALAAIHGETGERRRLQERFAQIFVDEYQDTSPIQDALVRAIQSDKGNLFVVGDVKQSIYRFRMAEPQLFLDKRREFQSDAAASEGLAIDLAANYRSRKEIVNMVNFVFENLFSQHFGGIVYDETARMRYGAPYPSDDPEAGLAGPVEFHLVARSHQSDDDALIAMEQEGLVMAQRIQDLMGACGNHRRQVYDAKQDCFRPLEYRDIVILLRSAKGRVNVILDVLGRAGIPAYGATSSGFFGALEVQWLISALATIDNPRRDVDLVTLLRSPMVGMTDDDLGWIRLSNAGTFYEAVTGTAKRPDAEIPHQVVEKSTEFLRQLQAWRTKARHAKAADVLKQVLEDTGVMYYLLGMPGGMLRKANIEALLDKARNFDAQSFDGVFGFVHRLRDTLRQDLDTGEARTLGENEDVVRVMTIHQSKGLEFPVVFVADLGKNFYQDVQERMFPLHRQYGFGPQFIDFIHGRRWKTVPSIAVEEMNLAAFLEEEARILYVALTRAKELLLLVGSHAQPTRLVNSAAQVASLRRSPLPKQTLMEAKTYLDWLLPVFLRHPSGSVLLQVLEEGSENGERLPQFSPPLQAPVALETVVWNTPTGRQLPLEVLAGERTEHGLPAFVPVEGSVKQLQRWLDGVCGTSTEPQQKTVSQSNARDGTSGAKGDQSQLLMGNLRVWPEAVPNATVPGKVTATDLRRIWAQRFVSDHHQRSMGSPENLLENPVIATAETGLHEVSQRARGVAFHTVMQHIDVQTELTDEAVGKALDRLLDRGVITDDDRSSVNISDVLDFFSSDIGMRLTRAKQVFREQGFFSRIPVTTGEGTSFVVVQGVIDCLAQEQGKWLLIDYKTDRIPASQATRQAQEYAAQVATYLQVARQVCGGEPIEAYLYFVHAKTFVRMDAVDLTRIFE